MYVYFRRENAKKKHVNSIVYRTQVFLQARKSSESFRFFPGKTNFLESEKMEIFRILWKYFEKFKP